MPAPTRPGAPRNTPRATGRSGAQADAVRSAAREGARRAGSGPATGPQRKLRTVAGTKPGRKGGGSGNGLNWAAVLSWRTLALVAVSVTALALILPSLRAYVTQQQELAALRAEVEEARAEVDDLGAEVARWDDPAYVIAQARERLAFVMPGETPYRVVDPEFVVLAEAPAAATEEGGTQQSEDPWFETMWASIQASGETIEASPTTNEDQA